MRRLVGYGEQSGVREFMTVVPPLPAVQGLLLRHGFKVVAPVYVFQLPPEPARTLATALSALLPGKDVTGELLGRRDPDRARLLREFLDGHVARIRSQSADPRVRDAKLGVTARSAARTGARILGWPGPNAQ